MARRIVVALPVIALGLLSSIILSSTHAGETWACNDSFSQVQSSETRPAFEVASIRPSAGCDGGSIYNPVSVSPGRLTLRCNSLRTLVFRAYGNQIVGGKFIARYVEVLGGPDWVKTDRYDVTAKAEGMASAGQMTGPMLQTLLEERFKLKVHTEIRNGPVYEMTVAKMNANLHPSKEGSCTEIDLNTYSPDMIRDMVTKGVPIPKRCGSFTPHSNGQTFVADFSGNSMAELAYNLLSYVGRPVLDKTGLAGRFDFHLEFAAGRQAIQGQATLNGMNSPPASDTSADPMGPTIFDALKQQLGLKLTPAMGPREVIIIDHAEKPSANNDQHRPNFWQQ